MANTVRQTFSSLCHQWGRCRWTRSTQHAQGWAPAHGSTAWSCSSSSKPPRRTTSCLMQPLTCWSTEELCATSSSLCRVMVRLFYCYMEKCQDLSHSCQSTRNAGHARVSKSSHEGMRLSGFTWSSRYEVNKNTATTYYIQLYTLHTLYVK